MVYCLHCLAEHPESDYLEEIERLRAALVEERANWIEAREGAGEYPTTRDKARAELIAEGLLPSPH